MNPEPAGPRVGLFVTCLVDMFRPAVGLAAARLIEEAGCVVEVPMAQTCCGQQAHHSDDHAGARATAQDTIRAFEGFDHVVAPSASCAWMLKTHYPSLFAGDPQWAERARAFSGRVHELVGFLTGVMGMVNVASAHAGVVTYHDACSGPREPGIALQPRALLAGMEGLELREMRDPDVCCGAGGGSCAKHPFLSRARADSKAQAIEASGADLLLAGDLGCLMGMAGRLKRRGSRVEARHVAEVLAGMTETPPIGGAARAPLLCLDSDSRPAGDLFNPTGET